MATVNKNFRVKNGLVVEGSTATVNGNDILTKSQADQNYIVDLIGGQATSTNTANSVVKRDGSGNFAAGTITADLTGNVTGNVTGTVSSIANHDTDDLAEGTTNLYFTNTRARQAISGGTGISYNSSTGEIAVDSTISTKTYADDAADAAEAAAKSYADGLAVNYDPAGSASTAQSNAETFATNAINALDTDDIEEGTTNKYFTNQRALDATAAAYDVAGSAASAQSAAEDYTDTALLNYTTTANLDSTIDGYGYLKSADLNGYATESYVDNAINALDTDDIEEGGSNLYFTNQRALDATSAAYDAYGSASTAEANAATYTDNAINALDTDDIEEGTSNKYFTDARARGAVSAGTGLDYNSSTGEFSVDTAEIATQSYVDTAISNLVDGAPALLDTLNELAAAINDDASFASTITNSISEKVAKSGDTMTGALVLHADPVNNLEAATKQYVDAEASAAQSGAESTAQGALNDVLDGTTAFTAINVNDIVKQVAAEATLANTSEATAVSWAKADYRTAKFLVKFAYGTHTDVSEVLLTLDTSDNVAITEYAIVTTNGSLGSVSADVSGNDVRLRVTAVNASTSVKVFGTLLV